MEDMTIEQWQDPETPGRQGLKLTGSMTIGQAAQIKELLVAALGTASELSLDLTGVTEIDLTGLQLLEASHRSALSCGKLLSVNARGNQAYCDSVAAAGFLRTTGCAQDTNGTCIWVGGEC
jgi:ABC-type transporter Mla MlaB component